MLVPPGGNRSDINEQILEGRHAEERERAHQAAMANEARPSWFKRLKATFKRDSSNKK
jgi:hypothetical protein